MRSSGQLNVLGISVSDVPSQIAMIWDDTLSGFRILTLSDIANGIYVSGFGSGSPITTVTKFISINNPNTYVDLSSGIRIVVDGQEVVNYPMTGTNPGNSGAYILYTNRIACGNNLGNYIDLSNGVKIVVNYQEMVNYGG